MAAGPGPDTVQSLTPSANSSLATDPFERLEATLKDQQILTKKHTVWTGDRINGNAASSVKTKQSTDYCVDNSRVNAGYSDVKKTSQVNINHKLYNFPQTLMKKDGDPLRSFFGGGLIFPSNDFIGPVGIFTKHWFIIFTLSFISSIRHKYLS